MADWTPISLYENQKHGDVVMLLLKDGTQRLGIFYDCQWMRDDPDFDDTPDAFSKYSLDDGNHFELEDIIAFKPATDEDRRQEDADEKFAF